MNKAFEKIFERLDDGVSLPKMNGMERRVGKSQTQGFGIGVLFAKEIVKEVAEEYKDGWIPVKTRPITEEEKEYYSEYLSEGNGMIYDCPLPDDGQEVLITSKYGSVDKTTFYTDCGNYFEQYEDYDEVIAWQPLPKPYKERE